MLNEWTHALFTKNLHAAFLLQHPHWGAVTLELVNVSDLREIPRQRMFSLVFRGPLEQPMEQGSYSMTHENMGTESLFIVPIAREADGYQYEAVFNNLVR